MSGHELNGLGVDRFLEVQDLKPRAIFHFGANVAGGEPDPAGGLRLTGVLALRASVEPSQQAGLERALEAFGVGVAFVPEERRRDPSAWVGEATAWCRTGAPLLSIAGGSPLFHAPEDVPESATTAGLLEASFRGARGAALVLAGLA